MATIILNGATASQGQTASVPDCFNRCNDVPFCDLLPHGAMWPRARDTNLFKLCSAMSIELGRVDKQVETMLAESFPDTAQQTLTHWEENCGIPDACDGEVAATIALRQQDVVDCWASDHSLNDEFWGEIAAKFGYAAPIITKNSPFCAGVNCAGDDATCSLEALLTVTFTFTNGADDALLECKIRKFWPLYATLIVIFVP